MEKLVRGVISNVIIDYIECKEDIGCGRHQMTIRKKTCFSVEDNTFYTFEDIEPIEGKEEIFYADEKYQVTFFGKTQVREGIEKNKEEMNAQNREINELRFITFILALPIGLILYDIPPLSEVQLLTLAFPIVFFFGTIFGYFRIRFLGKKLNHLKERVKKEKDQPDIFNKNSSGFLPTKEIKKEKFSFLKKILV